RLRERAGVVNVGGVGLRNELQRLVAGFDGAPVERRRNLEDGNLLGRGRIVAESNRATCSQPMLVRLDLNLQVIVGKRERLAVERQSIHHRGTEDTEEATAPAPGIHFALAEPSRARRWRTIS